MGRNSPLVAGDVEVHAQRLPHLTRLDAVFDRLGGGTPETGQHVIGQHRRTIGSAKSQGYTFVEIC